MNKLEEARLKINQIDEAMLRLFEERMKAVKSVAKYKIENQLPIFDETREKRLTEGNLSLLTQKELERYYRIFFDGVLKSSKEYQKDLFK